MKSDLSEIRKTLWDTADELRANSGLRPSEYARPVLGLLFLRYVDEKYAALKAELEKDLKPNSRRTPGPDDYKARGVVYLPDDARFDRLVNLPEDEDIGKELGDAMKAIEEHNPDLEDALPKSFGDVPKETLFSLLRTLQPLNLSGDAFGQVYEYFMGKFALETMQKGGEFYTPESIVRLIVEIIEPYEGRILDPACGSGGMFAYSADFVARHQREAGRDLSIYGIEKTRETIRLAKMNLAMHGLGGQVAEANTYYDDPFDCVGKFDYVMANPPFNVDKVDKAKLKHETSDGREEVDRRFPFGLPKADNANYLWISLFYAALNETGRAGFVMANSASDARGTEAEIRQKLIETGAVDVIVSVGPNFFYTVTLPCTLWFFDKAKAKGLRADEVLFIDARKIFNVIDRAHRDFTDAQVEYLANIVRLWRGDEVELTFGSEDLLEESFAEGDDAYRYRDVAGLCRAVPRAEIEAQGWSLNPGRYVGVADREDDGVDFEARLAELQEELEGLNAQAAGLQEQIALNVAEVLGR